MTRAIRIASVTFGLALAGALTGAICGVLALTPLLIAEWARSGVLEGFASFMFMTPWAAAAGAVLGTICGPLLAWSLLRHVPLWRVILWAAAGTLLGSMIGWAVRANPWARGLPSIFGGAVAGLIVAGIGLNRRARSSVSRNGVAAT